MAAQHRANRKTLATVYRVYRLPEDLRKRVKAKREKANVNLQSIIEVGDGRITSENRCCAQNAGPGIRRQEASDAASDDRLAPRSLQGCQQADGHPGFALTGGLRCP